MCIFAVRTMVKRTREMFLKRIWEVVGRSPLNMSAALVLNLLLALAVFMVARVVFLVVNYASFGSHLTMGLLGDMFRGGLTFDLSALVCVNAVYILMMLLPWSGKERRGYQLAAKLVFVFANSVALLANLADTYLFRFSGRRTTAVVLRDFHGGEDWVSLFRGEEFGLVLLILLFLLLVWGMWKFYCHPQSQSRVNSAVYYPVQVVLLLLALLLSFFAVRGSVSLGSRPVALDHANRYVCRPVEASVVLNTPFSVIRTIGKKPLDVPDYMPDAEMETLFSPLRLPAPAKRFNPKNVVVFVLENLGMEHFDLFYRSPDEDGDRRVAPFLNSLARQGYAFSYSFGNGQEKLDGMTATLASVPPFVEPLFVSPAYLTKVNGLAGELGRGKGYRTAFFYGAENGSEGIRTLAHAVGFEEYYGCTEYVKDAGFGASAASDGVGMVCDDEFFRFFCDKLTSFGQPFMAAVLNVSSGSSSDVPEHGGPHITEGVSPIYKGIRYTDYAMQRFFEQAKMQSWFDNTLFVVTADYAGRAELPKYQTDYGASSVPVIFYDPGADLRGRGKGVAQQMDIMPTVLGYLGYDKPYVSFGCDLFETPVEKQFAVNLMNGVYQFFQGDYVLQFDGEKVVAVYDYRADPLQKHNIMGRILPQKDMELRLKAIIRQSKLRMKENRLLP